MNKDNIQETFKQGLIGLKEEKYETEEEKKIVKRKPFFEICNGGMATVDKNKIIFLGIIDIFTEYG